MARLAAKLLGKKNAAEKMKSIILLRDPSNELRAEIGRTGGLTISTEPPVAIDRVPTINAGGGILSKEKGDELNSRFSVALVSEYYDSRFLDHFETALQLIKPTRNFRDFKLWLSHDGEVQAVRLISLG